MPFAASSGSSVAAASFAAFAVPFAVPFAAFAAFAVPFAASSVSVPAASSFFRSLKFALVERRRYANWSEFSFNFSRCFSTRGPAPPISNVSEEGISSSPLPLPCPPERLV